MYIEFYYLYLLKLEFDNNWFCHNKDVFDDRKNWEKIVHWKNCTGISWKTQHDPCVVFWSNDTRHGI